MLCSRAVSYQDRVYSLISNSGGPSCARKLLRHTSSRPTYTYIFVCVSMCRARWKKQTYRDRLTMAVHGDFRWFSVARERERKSHVFKYYISARVNMEGGAYMRDKSNRGTNDVTRMYNSNFHPLIIPVGALTRFRIYFHVITDRQVWCNAYRYVMAVVTDALASELKFWRRKNGVSLVLTESLPVIILMRRLYLQFVYLINSNKCARRGEGELAHAKRA